MIDFALKNKAIRLFEETITSFFERDKKISDDREKEINQKQIEPRNHVICRKASCLP